MAGAGVRVRVSIKPMTIGAHMFETGTRVKVYGFAPSIPSSARPVGSNYLPLRDLRVLISTISSLI
jgi:hypothetical protein